MSNDNDDRRAIQDAITHGVEEAESAIGGLVEDESPTAAATMDAVTDAATDVAGVVGGALTGDSRASTAEGALGAVSSAARAVGAAGAGNETVAAVARGIESAATVARAALSTAEAIAERLTNRVSLTFQCDDSDVSWSVESLSMKERIGRPYEVKITISTEDTSADPASLLGLSCNVDVDRGELQRRVNGLITSVEESATEGRRLGVELVIEPAVALLRQGKDTRIFQNTTVPDILQEVLSQGLDPAGREVDLRLQRTYPQCEYRTQYDESDLDFCHRLMEEEGITYWFEHDGDAETMVLTDDTRHAPDVETVDGQALEFTEYEGTVGGHEVVSELRRTSRVRPTRVVTRHYDWTNPGAAIEGDSGETQDDGDRHGARIGPERSEYEHDSEPLTLTDYSQRYGSNDADDQLRLRRERQACQAVVMVGQATAIGLEAGRIFEVTGHPRPGHDGRWLVIEASHEVEQRHWTSHFEAIPADVPFRPPRETPRPRVVGVLTARVTGPAGEEIHTDEHGRIKVQFHWDRQGQNDDHSSCWVRVLQPWAGAGWGFVFVPRIGMEVVITFDHGNPDHPLCTGAVYNGENPPPLSLPDQKTRSTIKTNSSLGGDGYNELTFEDSAGEEQIIVHAQKDYDETVENNHSTTVHGSQTNSVDGDHSNTIGGDHTETVHQNQTLTVDQNREGTIHGHQSFTITGGDSTHSVTAGSYSLDTSDQVTIQAPTKIQLLCGGSSIEMTPNHIILSAGGGAKLRLDADARLESNANSRVHLDGDIRATNSHNAKLELTHAATIKDSTNNSVMQLTDSSARMQSPPGSFVRLDSNARLQSSNQAYVQLTGTALVQGCAGGACVLDANAELHTTAGGKVRVEGPVVKLNP